MQPAGSVRRRIKEVKLVYWRMIIKRGRQGLPLIKGVLLVAVGFCLVSIAVFKWPYLNLIPQTAPVFAPGGGNLSRSGLFLQVLGHYNLDFVRIISEELPLPSRHLPFQPAATTKLIPWLSLNSTGLGVDLKPINLVQTELGWFQQLVARGSERSTGANKSQIDEALTGLQAASVSVQEQKTQPAPQKAEGPPRVAIYHTHTSEDYVPSSGNTHTYGQEAGIVAVGRVLAQKIEEHGIGVIHNTTIHDAHVFREAYLRSGDTINSLLRENPKLDVILDIHRDAPSKDKAKSRDLTTAEIDGQPAGRVYMIVGTDRLGLTHPNWHQNHTFAQELQEQLEELFPGLSRGIKIDTARFNQHLHPRLMLIEIGGEQNSLEEAKLGASCLADALAAWFEKHDQD